MNDRSLLGEVDSEIRALKQLLAEARNRTPEFTSHSGDCTIYSSLINGCPEDGICTCGYGWQLVRHGDWSQMYSEERIAKNHSAS